MSATEPGFITYHRISMAWVEASAYTVERHPPRTDRPLGFDGQPVNVPRPGMADWAKAGRLTSSALFGVAYTFNTSVFSCAKSLMRRNRKGVWVQKPLPKTR